MKTIYILTCITLFSFNLLCQDKMTLWSKSCYHEPHLSIFEMQNPITRDTSNYYQKVVVNSEVWDFDLIYQIKKDIDSLKAIGQTIQFDKIFTCYIFCIIETKTGKDTIAFGDETLTDEVFKQRGYGCKRFCTMYYNNKYYNFNEKIFKNICYFIPYDHKVIIDELYR